MLIKWWIVLIRFNFSGWYFCDIDDIDMKSTKMMKLTAFNYGYIRIIRFISASMSLRFSLITKLLPSKKNR